MRNARRVGFGMNEYIAAYRRIASAAYGRTAGFTFEAYADTVAQAIAGDIWRGRQHGFAAPTYSGGTYYMDGRPLNTGDPELWAVGGAVHETEIPFDEGEVGVYTDVLAACELLRDEIFKLQDSGVGDVYIGWWVTQERDDSAVFCFDVSNVVAGEAAGSKYDKAISLGVPVLDENQLLSILETGEVPQ